MSSQDDAAERARLAEQLITAEQDERRRLALFLHDGPVQALAGIALMLDAVSGAIEDGNFQSAKEVLDQALVRHRAAIRSLRDLSFSLEPVVLRDQGITPAVRGLADEIGLEREIQSEVDVDAAEQLGETVQAALYQIIRESLDAAVRRGPPTKMSVSVVRDADGRFITTIADDAPEERRRRVFDVLTERARTLSGRLTVDQGPEGRGTTIVLQLPASSAATK
ncbi:MAG: two-component system, NarL family, sensor kinase [Gaiellaceae bacterium]|nr:two-component system, NarL family, sensor kinase [Gaiellaceae bacterium]